MSCIYNIIEEKKKKIYKNTNETPWQFRLSCVSGWLETQVTVQLRSLQVNYVFSTKTGIGTANLK